MDECNNCICMKCKFKPCEDCFICDLDGFRPSNECTEFEKGE